ncbi:acyl-CoA synthetase [Paraglaciecola sp.]|uniref:ApeI family dehydratase n=1 Tax=Paraglaciecola sp. TaxID=1920173 RepID=UPI0030F428EA
MSEFVYHGEVLSVETQDNSVELQLRVPQNLYYFQGHFPTAPILPGVVMTHWVVEYVSQYFNADPACFKALSALKFQMIIGPDYTLTLKLNQVSENKYSFSYSSLHGQHASGKVLYT